MSLNPDSPGPVRRSLEALLAQGLAKPDASYVSFVAKLPKSRRPMT